MNMNFYKVFSKPSKNNFEWYWFLIGGVIVAVPVIVVGIFVWRRWWLKKQSTQLVKTLAKTLDLSPEEAQLFDRAREELYIDEKRLQIDFNAIIGKGASATVYAGQISGVAPLAVKVQTLETRRFENCRVAVKIGNQMGRDQIEQLIREVDAGRQILFHSHICTLLGWTLHKGLPALIYDAIEDGDLLTFAKSLRNSEAEFPHKKVLQIFWQVSDALKHIASLGLVHRDVAARNVLLGSGNVAKLADFGLCSTCDESFTYRASAQNKLPIRWLPPEALLDRLFSEASDVWSFGVLIWEVYAKGVTPFGELTASEIQPFLQQGGRLSRPATLVDDELWSLCLECWEWNKEKRPTFIQIQRKITELLEAGTENYGYLGIDQ